MAEKHVPITGGCLCGAVRYESTEPPVNGGYCHFPTVVPSWLSFTTKIPSLSSILDHSTIRMIGH